MHLFQGLAAASALLLTVSSLPLDPKGILRYLLYTWLQLTDNTVTALMKRIEIATLGARSYGTGGGAKVPDILDEPGSATQKRTEIASPGAEGYGTGGGAKVPDIPDDQSTTQKRSEIGQAMSYAAGNVKVLDVPDDQTTTKSKRLVRHRLMELVAGPRCLMCHRRTLE